MSGFRYSLRDLFVMMALVAVGLTGFVQCLTCDRDFLWLRVAAISLSGALLGAGIGSLFQWQIGCATFGFAIAAVFALIYGLAIMGIGC